MSRPDLTSKVSGTSDSYYQPEVAKKTQSSSAKAVFFKILGVGSGTTASKGAPTTGLLGGVDYSAAYKEIKAKIKEFRENKPTSKQAKATDVVAKNAAFPPKTKPSSGFNIPSNIMNALRSDKSLVNQAINSMKKEGASEEDIQKNINSIIKLAVKGLPKNASDTDKKNAITEALTSALKQIGTPSKSPQAAKANRLISLALGQMILKPQNTTKAEEGFSKISDLLNKANYNPGSCAEDLWRSMPQITVYGMGSKNPTIDPSTIKNKNEKSEKAKEVSNNMAATLNLFYQHVTKTKDVLIPSSQAGSSQGDAKAIGINLNESLSKMNMNDTQKKNMLLMFGLGNQAINTTEAGFSAIPPEFTQTGSGDLLVAELPKDQESRGKLEPLQIDRKMTIQIKENGHLEYTIESPIHFRDRTSKEPLGICRMTTKFTFNENMECISKNQEIIAA